MTIDEKLDKISDDVAAIKATIASQHVTLEVHTKRSDLLEQKMEILQKEANVMSGILQSVAYGVTSAGGIVGGLYALAKMFLHKGP